MARLRFSPAHLWVRVEGGEAVLGSTDFPDLINSEPYDAGWLLRIRLDSPAELDELMNEEEYMELTTEV